MRVKHYTNKQILEGLKNRDQKILEYIYDVSFPEIERFILKNNGSSDDAKDLFQEVIVFIYRKIKSENLYLTTEFKTYLFFTCKNKWLQQLRSDRIQRRYIHSIQHEHNDDESDAFLYNHKMGLLQKHFLNLAEDCKKLIKMFLNKFSMEEIAVNMGYKNAGYAKRRKFLCMNYLRSAILDDPEIADLYDNS